MRLLRFNILLILTLLFGALPNFAQSPDRELRGQFLNTAGQPVEGATIRIRAVTRASGTRYGQTDDVDASAKTDAKGEFVIHGKNPFLAATFTAEAPGYAKAVFTELPTGNQLNALTLVEGASIIGVVTKDGAPVPNVKIGLCDTDRGSRIFTIDLNATTDAKGRFRIANVPPKRDYYLFGFMHSFADKGALPSRRITTDADGSVLDLGELNVEPAYILDGHLSIQLPHIPILLSRYHGRDAQTADSGALGQFHFSGVPGEIMTVSIDAPGQRLSLNNASLNPSDPSHLVGRIVTNKTDLIIDIEPGPRLDPLNMSTAAAAEEPLRGAEPPTAGPNTIKVTGTVADADTGEKIASFETSEGRLNRITYDWFFTRAHRHKDGEFTTYLTSGDMPPLLVVQSENHLPWVSGPITAPTNFAVKLPKGIHAKGVAFKPDGAPATNVTVYLMSSFGHTRIHNAGFENTAQKATTDARGRFYFAPQPSVAGVIIYDPAGFAETPIDELLKTGEVHLEPLARIEGNLLIGSAPGTNQVIYLATSPAPYRWYPLELPAYSITLTTHTDTNGNFVFDRVPPTLIEIAHSPIDTIITANGSASPVASPAGAFRLTQTQRILPKPGETMHVTLGGQGRLVTGRLQVTDYDDAVDWRGSPLAMENIVPHGGPSDAAMKSLTEKLEQTRRPGSTKAERDAAEEAYNAERRNFALATQKYFATDEGMAALLATHRYYLQFDSDGNFRVDDVPPGKYRITGWLSNPDPSAVTISRRMIAPIDLEITVPEGKGALDLGILKIPAYKSPKAARPN
jgi:uncharacterized GH25 family protein